MICSTCGATLESTETACPVCASPMAAPTRRPSEGASALAGSADASSETNVPVSAGTGASGAGGGWPPPPTHPSGLSSEIRGWGIGAHLGGLIVGLTSGGAFGFLAPLLVWLLKRDEHPFIDHHAKESLNFQLTVLLVVLGGAVHAVPAVIFGILTLGIGLILLILLGLVVLVLWFVLPIVAAVKAGNGEGYRYPVVIRFVR